VKRTSSRNTLLAPAADKICPCRVRAVSAALCVAFLSSAIGTSYAAEAPPVAPIAKTTKLEYMHRFSASAAKVFALISDWNDTRLSSGYVDHFEVTGSGIGLQRTSYLNPRVGVGKVVEEMTALDPIRMSLAYRMVDNGPLPWAQYHGYMEVTPAGPDHCVLYSWASFTIYGPEVARYARISRQDYASFFRNIESALKEDSVKATHN
jgi:hypothetical protein